MHSYRFRLIAENKDTPSELNINCVDPLNRSSLIAAIENENIELIKILLDEDIKVNDALLHAISEEYVEAVELLLYHEETHHEPGKPYVTHFAFQSRKSNIISKWFLFSSHGKQSTARRQHLHQI